MHLWKYLPAELAHQLAPFGVSFYATFCGEATPLWQSFDWNGIHFPNRLGLAGGVDKTAKSFLHWQNLGCGFVEVGTVTPQAQGPNEGKIIDRDWNNKLLWNKMGFPNPGSDFILNNLQKKSSKLKIPLFINIGKNRTTNNDEAINDYIFLVNKFFGKACCFVVNISSPNTQSLRDLQQPAKLSGLVSAVVNAAGKTPVLIKLSPDLNNTELISTIEAAALAGAKGFILTNTTLSRPTHSIFPQDGGVSGQFLTQLAKKSLSIALETLKHNRSHYLVISAGGILNADHVKERLDMGADLTQVYSALIFNGPLFFQKTARYFKKLEMRKSL